MTWEPRGSGERALITIRYRRVDGSPIAGREARETIEAGVSPDGRWGLVYRMPNMSPQSVTGHRRTRWLPRRGMRLLPSPSSPGD